MSSSSETSAADAERAPVLPSPEMPNRRHSARLFLLGCLLALIALVGLLMVALQVHSQQATWENESTNRQMMLDSLTEKINEARSEYEKTTDQRRYADILRREVNQLSRDKTELIEEVDVLRNRKSVLSATVGGLIQEQQNLQTNVAEQQERRDSTQRNIQGLARTLRDLSGQIETSRADQKSAANQENEARIGLQAAQSDLQEVQRKVAAQSAILKKMQVDLNEKRGQFNELAGRFSEREESLSEAKSSADSWRQQATNAREDLEMVEAELKAQKAALSGLERQRMDAQQSVVRMKGMATTLEADIARLQGLKAANEAVVETLAENRKEHTALEQKLLTTKDDVARLTYQYQQLLNNLETLRASKTDIEQARDRAQTNLNVLEDSIQTTKSESIAKRTDLSNLKNEIDGGKVELATLQTNIRQLYEQEVALRAKFDSLTADQHRLTSGIEANKVKLATLDNQRVQLDKDIAGTRAERIQARADVDGLDTEIAELKARRNALLEQISALQEKIETKPNLTGSVRDSAAEPTVSKDGKKTGAE